MFVKIDKNMYMNISHATMIYLIKLSKVDDLMEGFKWAFEMNLPDRVIHYEVPPDSIKITGTDGNEIHVDSNKYVSDYQPNLMFSDIFETEEAAQAWFDKYISMYVITGIRRAVN